MKSTFLNRIGELPKYGAGICFERMVLAMQSLFPHDYPSPSKILVITGTNGKGSTSTLCEHLLRHHGLATAIFTSPHFVDFNERFKINGQPVDYQILNDSLTQVLKSCHTIQQQLNQIFGVFEVLMLVALDVFAPNDLDVMIFEAGIGGRYDPTRLLQSPLTALTSIDLDHTELLGDSLELIAYDKLDSAAIGGTTVLGNINPPLKSKLNTYAKLRKLTLINSDERFQVTTNGPQQLTIDGSRMVEPLTLKSHLTTKVDLINIQSALCLSELWLKSQSQPLQLSAIHSALSQCVIAGRFETICQQPEVIVDAAHTIQAYQLLVDTIIEHYTDKPIILLIGLSAGRDTGAFAEQLLRITAEHCTQIIITQAFKGIDSEALAQTLDILPIPPHYNNDCCEAYAMAKEAASRTNARILVIGGLFLAAEITAIERKIDTKQLFLY